MAEYERLRAEYHTHLDNVMMAAQLAAALEVSGWPKPGNVHRTADVIDATFEQFIAGSIALGPATREASFQGILAGLGKIQVADIGVGHFVKRSVKDVKAWHRDGNTHLGISLLFIPLCASAGYTFTQRGKIEPLSLRANVQQIMAATTTYDAVEVYEAVQIAEPSGLGQLETVDAPDVTDERAGKTIFDHGQTLFDLMKLSSPWDTLSSEWTHGMEISFKTGYPTLTATYQETGEINTATVHTFLTILSRFPDTFIARKVGLEGTSDIQSAVAIGLKTAREVSAEAADVLQLGGLKTVNGKNALFALDRNLRIHRRVNPGTTADLTAASLLIAVLCGLRP